MKATRISTRRFKLCKKWIS